MANNEEKVAIVKSPCYIHNKKTIFKNAITRAEAVEIMAKALHHNELRYVDLLPWVYLDSEIKRQFLERAEVALDAILGKEAGNVIH